MEWEKWGLFISLITPLFLGVGAWVNDALSKRKKKSATPEVIQGLPVDYETDYVKLLKQNNADLRRRNIELEKENKALRAGRNYNGNSDNH